MNKYPKPSPRGRPRLCGGDIAWIRDLRAEGKSYAWIAWKTGFAPKTAWRYCAGEWKDYIPSDLE